MANYIEITGTLEGSFVKLVTNLLVGSPTVTTKSIKYNKSFVKYCSLDKDLRYVEIRLEDSQVFLLVTEVDFIGQMMPVSTVNGVVPIDITHLFTMIDAIL